MNGPDPRDTRDPRDERLRNLLGRLPAMKAPPDFESRLARAIAERRRGVARWPGAWPAGLRTAAFSGAALLLVGVISFFVFRGGNDVETPPQFDGAPAPAGAPTESGATSPSQARPQASPQELPRESALESPQGLPQESRTTAPPTTERTSKKETRIDDSPATPAPRDVTAPPALPLGKSKTAAPLLLMEQTAMDSAALFFRDSSSDSALRWRDSARVADSLLRLRGLPRFDTVDTLETRPDSLLPRLR